MAQESVQTGSLLAGKYRILDLLGQGGMGSVYLAENVDIGRQVAIKVLKPELAADPQNLARFKQEARAAAAIGHPGIVEVLDLGALPEGGAYIVMERLEGTTLRERLARDGTLSPRAAVELIGAVLETLAAAHDKGVIHRDLKPDNLFLVERPVATTKILDFGISKFRGSGDVALTRTGMVMGTPLYMSPEQARGARDVGVGADLYSIGAILYEALSGQPPFPGESYNEVLAKVLMESAPPLAPLRPDVPAAMVEVIESMLTKDPHGRPPSAREAASRLRQAVGTRPVTSAPRPGTAPPLDATFTPPPRSPAAPLPLVETAPKPVAPAAIAATAQSLPRASPPDEPSPELAAFGPKRKLAVPIGIAVVLALGVGAFALTRREPPQAPPVVTAPPPPAPPVVQVPPPSPPAPPPVVVPATQTGSPAAPVPASHEEPGPWRTERQEKRRDRQEKRRERQEKRHGHIEAPSSGSWQRQP